MPLYEYQCRACGNRFERIQKFSDPLVEICPKCEGAVRKRLSSPAIQFKGSGWYITDYAKKTGTAAGDCDKRRQGGGDKAEKSDGGADKKAGGDSTAAASSDKPSAPAHAGSSSSTKSE